MLINKVQVKFSNDIGIIRETFVYHSYSLFRIEKILQFATCPYKLECPRRLYILLFPFSIVGIDGKHTHLPPMFVLILMKRILLIYTILDGGKYLDRNSVILKFDMHISNKGFLERHKFAFPNACQ